MACSLGPATPFPHRPATARGPAGHPRARTDSAAQLLLRCGLLGFTRVARPLSLSLSLRTVPTCQCLSSSSALRSSPPAFSFLRSPPMASHPCRRPLMESGQSTASLPYFPHRLAYITPSRPRLLSPSSAHYPELPPPVRTPLPSANADAKATRSTAGLPRTCRYSPIRVLALFCPATSSPARLFSL